MNFKINRKTWRCGREGARYHKRGSGYTRLLNTEGYMCCLGQICLQLGLKRPDILGVASPDSLSSNNKVKILNNKHGCNSELASKAIEINDNMHTTVQEKEKKLKSLFSKFKHKIEFYN